MNIIKSELTGKTREWKGGAQPPIGHLATGLPVLKKSSSKEVSGKTVDYIKILYHLYKANQLHGVSHQDCITI